MKASSINLVRGQSQEVEDDLVECAAMSNVRTLRLGEPTVARAGKGKFLNVTSAKRENQAGVQPRFCETKHEFLQGHNFPYREERNIAGKLNL